MPFQFQCPSGHLLEAEETQVGQQSQCPLCGQAFAIPAPAGMAPAEQPDVNPLGSVASVEQPQQPVPFDLDSKQAVFDPTGQLSGPQLLHIPCPNGHELEVPPEMINQQVMCPHCSVQFLLRKKDSAEHKRRRKEQLELKDHKAGKTWLMWAVIFAVTVLLGLVAMLALNAD